MGIVKGFGRLHDVCSSTACALQYACVGVDHRCCYLSLYHRCCCLGLDHRCCCLLPVQTAYLWNRPAIPNHVSILLELSVGGVLSHAQMGGGDVIEQEAHQAQRTRLSHWPISSRPDSKDTSWLHSFINLLRCFEGADGANQAHKRYHHHHHQVSSKFKLTCLVEKVTRSPAAPVGFECSAPVLSKG